MMYQFLLLRVQLAFSYQINWHGRGEYGEILVPKIIVPLFSERKGEGKKNNQGMKIPVESVSVMFRLASKVYGYADNLSYILFKYKNCWRYIEIAEFYVVLNV